MINFYDYYSLEQLQFIAYTMAILCMVTAFLFFLIRFASRSIRFRRRERLDGLSNRIENMQNDHKNLWDLFSSVHRRADKHAEITGKRLDDIEATLRTILPKTAKKPKASKASPHR